MKTMVGPLGVNWHFAKKYWEWTIDDWSHVIFSNETKINRFSQMREFGVRLLIQNNF